ncbi:MAG: right-handed parallel beta-helix repeat-containing protein [bacterium]|nr:right-handed parallel beta-helix repeat-containing protein [bacterium]
MLIKVILIAILLCLGVQTIKAETFIPAGPVSGTWTLPGSPYLIEGEITVPTGQRLIIDPGVAVIFMDYYKFIVKGQLIAVGTVEDSISFSAIDTIIGWHGLRFINTIDTSQIRYCNLSYGRAVGDTLPADYCGGAIFCQGSSLIIDHSHIWLCVAYGDGGGGIGCIGNSNVTVQDCLIEFCEGGVGGGIFAGFGASVTVDSCTITGCTSWNGGGGIALWNANPSIIANNVIANNTDNGT